MTESETPTAADLDGIDAPVEQLVEDDETDESETEQATLTEITHKHTAQPYYDDESSSPNKYVRHWPDVLDAETPIDHTVEQAERDETYPVVLDIETNAATPQRPILCTVYDSKSRRLTVNYLMGYDRADFTREDLEHVAESFTGRGYPVHDFEVREAPSHRWFETHVIRPIANADDRVLVAHNAFFDMGVMARPNDDLIYHEKVDSDRWDGCFEYHNLCCLHHRAGAHGRLYSFRDAAQNFEFLSVPVADTSTVAKALQLPATLEGAADHFGIEYADVEGEHGNLTLEYIEYNVDDVAATLDLFYALKNRMREGFNTSMPLSSVYSTASIAKDVLSRMDYSRAHYTQQALDVAAPAYFGGNTEALAVGRVIDDTTYMDILSQYPTVCALTDVWDYMQAEQVSVRQIDPDVLPDVSVEDIRDPQTWRDCSNYYVVLDADDALLPVRTEIDTGDTTRVYNAHVTHDDATTHHYFDYLAAKLHADGGADIEIRAAFEMRKDGLQQLSSTKVGGTEIDAYDNVMKRGIEERKRIQIDVNGGEKDERTKSLKIMANASYGITAERVVGELNEPNEHGHQRHDVAGKFYNPHVASTITAGGRLQLALGEHAARHDGGQLFYCDTDSLIVGSAASESVIDAYDSLNPYDGTAGNLDVLEVEDTTVPADMAERSGLPVAGRWTDDDGTDMAEIKLDGCGLFAVGEKKYCILGQNNEIVKFTEHGLGHYKNFRGEIPIQKFWASVMHRCGLETPTERLDVSEEEQILRWQASATTAVSRKLIEQKLDVEIRYGDFIERSINERDGVNYIGIDLDEQAIKVYTTDDGDVMAERVDEIDTEPLKTVSAVVGDFWTDALAGSGARPHVRVVGREVVTKEASDVVDEWDAMLTHALEAVRLELFF